MEIERQTRLRETLTLPTGEQAIEWFAIMRSGTKEYLQPKWSWGESIYQAIWFSNEQAARETISSLGHPNLMTAVKVVKFLVYLDEPHDVV
jgi:hypothetical protein